MNRAAGPGGFDDRVADAGGSGAVGEGGAVGPDPVVAGDGADEVRPLVGEGVVPPEPVPGRPPVGGEGMLGLGHEAIVWVSWPKKAAGVSSEVTEDTVRDTALPLGFVDVKVCAVDDTWSGLKLVVRKELR